MKPATVGRKGALSVAFELLFSTPFSSEAVTAYDTLYAEKAARLPAPSADHLGPIRAALFGVGVGALVLGGTMSIMALTVRNDARQSTQPEIPSLNRKIERYDTAAIALYSIAAASGISWLTLKLLSSKREHREVTLFPMVSPTDLSLRLAGSWGN